MRGAAEFGLWCEARGVTSLAAVQPIHVTAWIEELGQSLSVVTVKQRLAGIRALFDWLVVGQVVPVNPTASVRGPRQGAEIRVHGLIYGLKDGLLRNLECTVGPELARERATP